MDEPESSFTGVDGKRGIKGKGKSWKGRAQQEGTWRRLMDGKHGRQHANSGNDNNNCLLKCLLHARPWVRLFAYIMYFYKHLLSAYYVSDSVLDGGI